MARTATVTPIKKFQAPKPIRRKINLPTPMGTRNTHTVEVVHEEDPREALLRRIGEIPDGLVQFSRILVAIYQAPVVEKTAGGIILTDKMKASDLEEHFWQGKVGLIVAMGPQAYVDDTNVTFHGTANKVGDWVWFRPSDGMACEVNEVFCRLFYEKDIVGKLPHPDAIW